MPKIGEFTSVRKAAPEALRRRGRRAYVVVGSRTARHRPLPDFVVVGAQRCGTTSLFRALIAHPQIARPTFHKGINYFDLNYTRGLDWYRGHFPVDRKHQPGEDGSLVYFEASGYYAYHPFAMERMARDLPGVRVVMMLRDPVERAYSAYEHERARGFEWESLATALAVEEERLTGEVDRMRRDPTYESFSHRHHSYQRRGDYVDQLNQAVELFGRERLHVIDSHRFFDAPEKEFLELTNFLGLAPYDGIIFDRYNARPRVPLDADTELLLRERYVRQEAALTQLLGRPPSWAEEVHRS
jgi:hypothetical protein